MRLGNQKKKKNNKGFSLVELIVVVLIIAIIAVALAPQVMKWVGTAKTNVDANNAATIKSAATIAYTDFISQGCSLAADTTNVEVSKNGIEKAAGENDDTYKATIRYYLNEVFNGDYPQTKNKTNFKIEFTKSGKVTVSEVTP